MITECGPNCGCGLDCGNRATQKGVAVQVEIVRVVNKGWGLFAAQFIQSGQFVCEYTGVQTPAAEPRAIRKGRNANLLNKRDGVRLYVFFSSMSLWLHHGIIETSEGMVNY